MLSITDGYRAAVVGDVRRMLIKAVLEIVDPDITFGASNGSGAAAWSKPEQLHDKELSLNSRYATLEPGRWVLDGSFRLIRRAETPMDYFATLDCTEFTFHN